LWFDDEGGGDEEFRKWIEAKDSRILKNKCHVVNTRKYNFGCDQVGIYEDLVEEFRDDVIFVDRFRFNVEFGNISAIKDTRATYGFIGPKPGEVSVTDKGQKKYTLLVRSAPCGCIMCRNGDFEKCKYEGVRYTQQKQEIFKKNETKARTSALISHDDASSGRWTWDGGLYPDGVVEEEDEPPDDEESGDDEEEDLPLYSKLRVIVDGVHYVPSDDEETFERGVRVKRTRKVSTL